MPGPNDPAALRGAATALGVLAAAVVLFGALNVVVWDRPLNGRVTTSEEQVAPSEPASEPAAPITRTEQLSYTWQLYLPRLPFMQDQFAYYPLWQTFFKGTIGVFGWLDTPIRHVGLLARPDTRDSVSGAAARSALASPREHTRALGRAPDVRAHRRGAAGLDRPARDLAIGATRDIRSSRLATCCRCCLSTPPAWRSRRAVPDGGFERPVAALVVTLALAHGLFAQLLVISRFYG